MDPSEAIEKTRQHVEEKFRDEGSGHDYWHIYRVWKNAQVIGKAEGADMFTVELASLLHDIADFKEHNGDTEAGPREAGRWLRSLGLEEDRIEHICEIIRRLSFKGLEVEEEMKTTEGKVVRDADRLDAIGAIGIARCFVYGGSRGRPIYDPNIKPTSHKTKDDYLNSLNNEGTSINHFYEKSLHLKGLMLTETGKKMAEGRHRFMEQYLEQFFREWNNKD